MLGYFHPTFLYELIWTFIVAAVIVLLDRRFRMGRGNVFALYVAGYCVGRFFIERLRIDEAEVILGQRINVWTSIVVFACAVLWIVLHRGPRESTMYYGAEADRPDGDPAAAAESGEGAEPPAGDAEAKAGSEPADAESAESTETSADEPVDETVTEPADESAPGPKQQ